MRKARYLAPWHREGVDLGGCGDDEGPVAEALAGLCGKPAIYHCVSRIVNRDFVLEREEKEKFVGLMRLYERFCQVRVLTFCVMSNHFHILLEVPAAPEDRGASWTDEELLRHLECLYSEREMGELRWELGHYREQKMDAAAEAFREKYFARMWDLSAYMKVLKQCFTQWFNGKHGRVGILWEGRFKSVLVEDGHAARTVAAYVDLNPVRAGLVSDPKDYRWSGYGEAVAGKGEAREGLRLVLFEKLLCLKKAELAAVEVASWRELARSYRLVLFQEGKEGDGDGKPGRRGISREEVERVLAEGGELSEAEMMFCRARHLVDGLVIGSEGFVNGVYALTRDHFGELRTSGARKLRRVQTSLRTMRDLQRDPVSL
jgi:putative transposase